MEHINGLDGLFYLSDVIEVVKRFSIVGRNTVVELMKTEKGVSKTKTLSCLRAALAIGKYRGGMLWSPRPFLYRFHED